MAGDYNMIFAVYVMLPVKYRIAYLITFIEGGRSEFSNILLIST
jgi:hypothetical protein